MIARGVAGRKACPQRIDDDADQQPHRDPIRKGANRFDEVQRCEVGARVGATRTRVVRGLDSVSGVSD